MKRATSVDSAAIVTSTDSQQPSVRGFLAGVVRLNSMRSVSGATDLTRAATERVIISATESHYLERIIAHGLPADHGARAATAPSCSDSRSIKSAESWGMPALTRRRDHMHAAHRGARDHLELARSLSVTFSGVRRDLVFAWEAS
jgi:hypothetical protein